MRSEVVLVVVSHVRVVNPIFSKLYQGGAPGGDSGSDDTSDHEEL